MAFITNVSKNLINSDFYIAMNLLDGYEISDNSRYSVFLKNEGNITYCVSLINCEVGINYEDFTKALENGLKKVDRNTVLICLYIFNDRSRGIEEYATNDVDDYSSKFVNIRWVVDPKNKKIRVKGSQPTDIIGLKSIIESSFESDSKKKQ